MIIVSGFGAFIGAGLDVGILETIKNFWCGATDFVADFGVVGGFDGGKPDPFGEEVVGI